MKLIVFIGPVHPINMSNNAIKNLEAKLAEDNLRLPGRCSTPMPTGCCPEMDTSPLLSDKAINYYQSQISILRAYAPVRLYVRLCLK